MDGTLIDSVGIWNKTDEILINELNGTTIAIPNIQQIRDSILAQCESDDIYLEYCDYLRKRYNSSMTAEDILALRWQISDEFDVIILYKRDLYFYSYSFLHKTLIIRSFLG